LNNLPLPDKLLLIGLTIARLTRMRRTHMINNNKKMTGLLLISYIIIIKLNHFYELYSYLLFSCIYWTLRLWTAVRVHRFYYAWITLIFFITKPLIWMCYIRYHMSRNSYWCRFTGHHMCPWSDHYAFILIT